MYMFRQGESDTFGPIYRVVVGLCISGDLLRLQAQFKAGEKVVETSLHEDYAPATTCHPRE